MQEATNEISTKASFLASNEAAVASESSKGGKFSENIILSFFQRLSNKITVHTKADLLQLKLIHWFARELLLMKKLEIEKTKPTFIISVFKVEY